jgi:hypothetical protein
MVVGMGLLTMLALSMGMMLSLNQFTESSASEWVKLAELTGRQFKAKPISVRVNLKNTPRLMVITYSSLVDSHYDLSVQNTEMENVSKFALQNYSQAKKIDEVQVTRSETHGRGCFQQTFVSHFTYPNPNRQEPLPRFPVDFPQPPRR